MRYRTVFLSDVHLGSRNCQAEKLLQFLRTMTCDRLYLVGDIVDLWALRRHWFWPESHNSIVRELITLAEGHTEVVYLVGNHDPMLHYIPSLKFGEIQAQAFATHETVTGKRLWVVHGDCVDLKLHYRRWQALIGGGFYCAAQWANRVQKNLFSLTGRTRQWSLHQYIKTHLPQAIEVIERFERMMAEETLKRGYDGVVCGHIHHANVKTHGGIHYYNCGDWVDSCTVLVENFAGELNLVQLHDILENQMERKKRLKIFAR